MTGRVIEEIDTISFLTCRLGWPLAALRLASVPGMG
jgi:hypothetical protein